MDAETKSRVRDPAGNRCEYCRSHQQHYIITFHVEHIVARQHHGSNDGSNLMSAGQAAQQADNAAFATYPKEPQYSSRILKRRCTHADWRP
jgi:hypothetical protein